MAHRLVGQVLPSCMLQSTQGTMVNPARQKGKAVWFFHPYTGKPGVPDPENWDNIRGAHGSTPQALAYAARLNEFADMNVAVFGVSLMDPDWQQEFVTRNALQLQLLSDQDEILAAGLGLEIFETGGRRFLKRLTLLTEDAGIIQVRDDFDDPKNDSEQALARFSER